MKDEGFSISIFIVDNIFSFGFINKGFFNSIIISKLDNDNVRGLNVRFDFEIFVFNLFH